MYKNEFSKQLRFFYVRPISLNFIHLHRQQQKTLQSIKTNVQRLVPARTTNLSKMPRRSGIVSDTDISMHWNARKFNFRIAPSASSDRVDCGSRLVKFNQLTFGFCRCMTFSRPHETPSDNSSLLIHRQWKPQIHQLSILFRLRMKHRFISLCTR